MKNPLYFLIQLQRKTVQSKVHADNFFLTTKSLHPITKNNRALRTLLILVVNTKIRVKKTIENAIAVTSKDKWLFKSKIVVKNAANVNIGKMSQIWLMCIAAASR